MTHLGLFDTCHNLLNLSRPFEIILEKPRLGLEEAKSCKPRGKKKKREKTERRKKERRRRITLYLS